MDNSDGKKVVDNSSDKKGYDKSMVEPNNTLGFSLIDQVEPDENNNVFISPTSALLALFMAYNGAEGETKEEMAEALEVSGISVEHLNQASASLVDKLEKDSESIQLSIANSLWINEKFHFKEKYAQDATSFFQAELSEIDIKDNASVDKINEWVRQSTNDKIDEIVKAPLDRNMVALLINALYFKGKWKYKFDEANTEELPFKAIDSEKNIPFMVLEEELEYMENDKFQAVKLPYGNGEMSMNIFLPNGDFNLEYVMNELTTDNYEAWRTEFIETKGTVKLPKFKIEYETVLNQALKQLGMELAFDEKEANFSNMIKEDDPLWIHEVKQKTYIDVNEEGTEAAAVTSIEMRTESAVIEDTFYMEVNRPFFFTITEEETGVILFIGIIREPSVS